MNAICRGKSDRPNLYSGLAFQFNGKLEKNL